MNIIDIHERINAKNGPDPEHVRIGADGDGRPQKWFEFSVSFFIDGGEFPFEIWALDKADAERRVDAIRQNAVLVGQVLHRSPV